MTTLDVAAVMTSIADAVSGAGVMLRTYDYPTNTVNPPCLVVGYPEGPQPFDATYARGFDRATFPCWAVLSEVVKRSSRDLVSAYVMPLKAALEPNLAGAVETCRVVSWAIEPFSVEGLDYVAVKLDIDVLT